MDWSLVASEHRKVADFVCGDLVPQVEAAASLITDSVRRGGIVYACGNGGSAADAQHFAAELVNRFLLERDAYASIALTTDSSVLTSIANDYEYDRIFSRQVEALGREGDLLLAISTSGNSPNIVEAVRVARTKGMKSIGLLGGAGGALQDLVDVPLTVSVSSHTPRIQEGHLIIMHALCELSEAALAQAPNPENSHE